MTPDKNHRRAGSRGENDAARYVLVRFLRAHERTETIRKKSQASAAIENGFTIQFTSSVTRSPAGRLPTLRTAEKSTFIIIGVIISQIRTAIGAFI